MRILFLCLSLLAAVTCSAEKINVRDVSVKDLTTQVIVDVALDKDQHLLRDSISFSSNNPDLAFIDWKSTVPAKPLYVPLFRDTKDSYVDKAELVVTLQAASSEALHGSTDLFMHYVTDKSKDVKEHKFVIQPRQPLAVEPVENLESAVVHTADSRSAGCAPSAACQRRPLSHEIYDGLHVLINLIKRIAISAQDMVSHLLSTTQSLFLQCILALMLGVLMSLTPCIYPMIPITIGVLGAGASKSVVKNFFLALAYTLGMATMFAVLGLVVTSCGVHCGQLLVNPLFVIVLVAFLAYLGFSMFGLYEMYIPRFLQPRQGSVKQGSWISAFFFGMVSGTIASPCMSPGLALLLSIVTSLGSKLVGFLLLFVFGIGSSIPLLIIGTFSSSLQVLPRAGMWMVEVKKIFGFMLISICFYYLQNILPLYLVMWLGSIFFIGCGWYCLVRTIHARTFFGRLLAFVTGLLLIASGVYGLYGGYKQWYGIVDEVVSATESVAPWRTDYSHALEQAIQTNSKVLLDFGADWCSLCTQLEKQVLRTSDLMNEINKLPVIAIKIDGTIQSSEPYASLMKEFTIVGLPTVILLDPKTRTVIKKWHSELLQRPVSQFAEELRSLVQ